MPVAATTSAFGGKADIGRWPALTSGARSFRPDIVCSDYFAPLFGVFSDEVAKIGRRHRFWNAADLCKSRHYLWIGERRIDCGVKFIDYFCRRVLWCDQAIPHACLIARYKLPDGRHVW